MKIKLILIWCLLVTTKGLIAQINNQGLTHESPFSDSSKGTIGLHIVNQSYFKNNEYFHDLLTGYTLFGNMLHTQLSYQMDKHWKLSGGLFLRKDFGNAGLKQIEPLIRIYYHKDGYDFILGNLKGNIAHRLLEPLYNYERFILHHNEYGMQFTVNQHRLWSDTWLNWEVMQYNQSPYQEQFSGGHSSQYALVKNAKQELGLSFQGLITHKGGQLDIDSTPLQTKLNTAWGIQYQRHLGHTLTQWQMQAHYLTYNEINPSPNSTLTKGSAAYINTSLSARGGLVASLGYWKGNHFISSRGGDLFQSTSSIYTKKPALQVNRELLLMRLFFQKEVAENLYLDIRVEPYYDIANSFMEYSYSLYISYKKDFVLVNERNHQKR